MTTLDSQAEVLKLARLLDTPVAGLSYLERVDAGELRALRERMTDVLFDANQPLLRRMAAASKLLPSAVTAKIAERTFGPMLCARIAGLVEVSRAVDVAKRLDIVFLADVAAQLDPRRATSIITRIPRATILDVARELVRREDWITIGRFVGHLPEDTVRACLNVLHDAALLHTAFVLDDKAHAGEVIGLLPLSRFDTLAQAAAEHDLWAPTLDLLTHIDAAHRAHLLAGILQLDADVVAVARAEAAELGLEDLLTE